MFFTGLPSGLGNSKFNNLLFFFYAYSLQYRIIFVKITETTKKGLNMDKTLEFLKEITDLNGIPGQEGKVKNYMAKKMEGIADEIVYDGQGGLVGFLKGNADGPVIMCDGHLDEVGFMVTGINAEGYLSVTPLGGWNPAVVSAHEVVVTTTKGELTGIVGAKPPHSGGNAMDDRRKFFEGVFIDIGATSKDEAIEMGVKIGDMVTPYQEFKVLGKDQKHLLAKAWDCRIGCAMVIDIMKNLKEQGTPNIYAGSGSVQEEVGCRGAGTTAYIASPKIGFAFDVSLANDYPGGGDKDGFEFGKGPQIHLMDSGMLGHRGLFSFVTKVADELNIPYQVTVLKAGGTDGAKISQTKFGAPTLFIGIPSRYIHSQTSMIYRDDYENGVKLMTEVIKRLDHKAVEEIWKN